MTCTEIKQQDLADLQIKKKPSINSKQKFEVAEPLSYYDKSLKDNNEYALDEHGHLVVKHDLFSNTLAGGIKTPDGIAEAFVEFAKKENLSFFV